MKIIGQTPKGYVVEMTGDEVANICGFYYSNSDDFRKFLEAQGALERGYNHGPRLAVPSELPVGAWWARLRDIRSREAELRKTCETLRGLADLVEGAWPAIKADVAPDEAP